MSEPTFGDLWKSLDWSAAEEEEATWDADNPSEYTHTDDFKQRLRMTYLEQSLWGETKELRQEARRLNLRASGTCYCPNQKSWPMSKVSEEQLRRVCRMYNTNEDARRALRLRTENFIDLCAKLDIETPLQRKKGNKLPKNS